MPRLLVIALLVSVLSPTAGCVGSRWAKGDPVYDRKYPVHTDKPLKMAKQAIDARSVTAGRGGWYSGVAASDRQAAAEVTLGAFTYPAELEGVIEHRAGIRGLALLENEGGIAGGLELGTRLQVPARLAPYVGASAFLGGSSLHWVYTDDGIDQTLEDTQLAAAITPEAGVHFWLTPEWRLSASVSHTFVDFEGSGAGDYTMYGVSLSRLGIPGFRSPYQRNHRDADIDCTTTVTASAELPLPESKLPDTPKRLPRIVKQPKANPYAALLSP